jgi:acylphosphatase
MDEQRVRVTVRISGRVQGVWFRQSTASEASAIGVDGWVRNLADGRVEAVFEGTPDVVALALDYVSHGPDRAVVEDVQVVPEMPQGIRGFSVR